eukprot:399049_1
MLQSYLFVEKLNKKSHIFGNNMALGIFETDFNATCGKMLDVLGVCDYEERNILMNKLTKYDQSTHGLTHHATRGLYNKHEQINMLLNNTNICLYLKNLTNALDLKWE